MNLLRSLTVTPSSSSSIHLFFSFITYYYFLNVACLNFHALLLKYFKGKYPQVSIHIIRSEYSFNSLHRLQSAHVLFPSRLPKHHTQKSSYNFSVNNSFTKSILYMYKSIIYFFQWSHHPLV
jgi:hypothetical protein